MFLQAPVQPGSMDSEAGVYSMTFDLSGSRLITTDADKTIKIYKEDDTAVRYFCFATLLFILINYGYFSLKKVILSTGALIFSKDVATKLLALFIRCFFKMKTPASWIIHFEPFITICVNPTLL
jgi:hypothetical protein